MLKIFETFAIIAIFMEDIEENIDIQFLVKLEL